MSNKKKNILIVIIVFILAFLLCVGLRYFYYFIMFTYYNIRFSIIEHVELFQISDIFPAAGASICFYLLFLSKQKIDWKFIRKSVGFFLGFCIIYTLGYGYLSLYFQNTHRVINNEYVILLKLEDDENGSERVIATRCYIEFDGWYIWISKNEQVIMTLNSEMDVYQSNFNKVTTNYWD